MKNGELTWYILIMPCSSEYGLKIGVRATYWWEANTIWLMTLYLFFESEAVAEFYWNSAKNKFSCRNLCARGGLALSTFQNPLQMSNLAFT